MAENPRSVCPLPGCERTRARLVLLLLLLAIGALTTLLAISSYEGRLEQSRERELELRVIYERSLQDCGQRCTMLPNYVPLGLKDRAGKPVLPEEFIAHRNPDAAFGGNRTFGNPTIEWRFLGA